MLTKSIVPCAVAIAIGATSMMTAVAANASGAKKSFVQAVTVNPSNDVYVNGQYVGSDPDPRIRWSIAKEARGKIGN